MTATETPADEVAPVRGESRGEPLWSVARRWLPLVATLAFVAAVLLAADTSPVDLLRFAAYATLTVILPGTLVYRALRRDPRSLVEDLAMGAAVGLGLELAAWLAFAALDLRRFVWLWPLAVFVPFAAVRRLRRHWWERGLPPVPLGWSWAVGGVVAFFTYYLSQVFLERNPILPDSEGTNQYLDLAYQLSLAGEAKHQFPIHLPQVASEPLHYHWFGYVHAAMASLVGGIDLPVVALRLAVPALCAAAIVLTAVVGWRVSGRPYVGAGAAVLVFVIGEVNFTHFVTQPFGTQAAFVIWHGMSMIYSWVLLIALIAVLADLVGRRVDRAATGGFVLAALLLFASSGAKASSLPVVVAALAFTGAALLLTRRRIPWAVVVAGVIACAAQLFAVAALYAFQTYGVALGPLDGLATYYRDVPGRPEWVTGLAAFAIFLVNMQSRVAGAIPLVWLRRGQLEPGQWLLLGGALAGPAIYLVFDQPGDGNQYFTRAGFVFGVIVSAWGFAMVLDRARLSALAKGALASGALAFAVLLVLIHLEYAGPPRGDDAFSPIAPIGWWALVLLLVAVMGAALWRALSVPWPALRGRGAVVLLTGVLVAGAPGLVMDIYKSRQVPNGGAYTNINLPASRVAAARWVRDHSDPRDVVATNVHCLAVNAGGVCDSRSFWLTAYAERRVLVEGWGFAPRTAAKGLVPFWDADLLRRNDAAFTAPTAAGLAELRDRHGVRFLVVDRQVGAESADLASLAPRRFDNGRLAVYEIP